MRFEEFLVLVVIVFFFSASFLFAWYFIQKTKMKERLLFLEKGIDINNLIPKEKPKSNYWLKIGIIIISASLGLLSAISIESLQILPKYYNGALPLIFLFLFGGIGMIIAHYADRPKEQK